MTFLYRIKLYRGANDHANTQRTQARAKSDPGCGARRQCSPDSEEPAREGWRSSRTRRGHHETGDGAQHTRDTDWRAAVAMRRFPMLWRGVISLLICVVMS